MKVTKSNHYRFSFWDSSKLVTPIVARLLARDGPHGRPLSDAQISKASGLSMDQVFMVSHMTSWIGIDSPTQEKFLTGCRIDLFNCVVMRRVKRYLGWPKFKRRPVWKFLRTSPEWESKFKPLLIRYRNSLKPSTR